MPSAKEIDRWRCMGCGKSAHTEAPIVTRLQSMEGKGYWSVPPRGWLCLIDKDASPAFVCSLNCVYFYEQRLSAVPDSMGTPNERQGPA